jgi:aldehyde:ferredoxin oxidoreductase
MVRSVFRTRILNGKRRNPLVRIRDIKGCLAGKILRVDLSSGRIWTEHTREYVRKTLGGRGINSLIMLNEIEPNTKWNDPENLLCLGAGSLVGTMAPGACRVDVSTINVFSGGKGSANVGGFWGPELKYAGFDNVIVRGKSKKPVYLYVNDGHIELRDAGSIWGKTTFETENVLRRELGDNSIRIASIGPAGENRVKGSAVIIDTAKAAGGSGVGCVMGDKKLKAVVVRGHGRIDVAKPKGFMKEVAQCYQQCEEEPNAVLPCRTD